MPRPAPNASGHDHEPPGRGTPMSIARRKILLGITSLSAAGLLGRAAEATVWNGEELRHALATLGRGSCIRLKPGYDYGGVGGIAVDTENLLIEGEGPDCTVQD